MYDPRVLGVLDILICLSLAPSAPRMTPRPAPTLVFQSKAASIITLNLSPTPYPFQQNPQLARRTPPPTATRRVPSPSRVPSVPTIPSKRTASILSE